MTVSSSFQSVQTIFCDILNNLMWLTFAKYNQKIDVDSQELISNLSIFSDSNPNCGRFLFINYINLIGLWDQIKELQIKELQIKELQKL